MTTNAWLSFGFSVGAPNNDTGPSTPAQITTPRVAPLEALDFTYEVRDVLTNAFLGRLNPINVTFNQPITGSGSLTCRVYISQGQRASIDNLTRPDEVALYVRTGDTYWFGGPIVARPWTPSGRYLSVSAVHWKQWYSTRFLSPLVTEPPADQTFAWTNVDQLEIAKDVIRAAVDEIGCPTCETGDETSTVLRTVNFQGSAFKFAGDFLDDLSQRDQGFDWDIQVINDDDNQPVQKLVLYYPYRGGARALGLLRSTISGGNMTLPDEIDDTAENKRTRVWATGSGSPPDQIMTIDEDATLSGDVSLDAVQAESYSSKSAEINTRTTTDPQGGGTELYNIITANDWATYVTDFGTIPPTSLSVRAASKDGCQVQIRLGSNTGTILGTVVVPALGDYKTWATVAGALNQQLTGTQTITLVFVSPSIVLNWLQLNLPDPSQRSSVLLRETVYNYSDTNDEGVLGTRAIAERTYLQQPRNQMQVSVSLGNPDVRSYATGDRMRVLVQDDWLDLDLPAVRITDREFNIAQEDNADFINLTLDLNDHDEPLIGDTLDESGDGS